MRPASEPPRGPSLLAVLTTAIMGTLAFLLVLGILLGPGPPLVAGGIFALVAFHYIVWGWQLERRGQGDDEETCPSDRPDDASDSP